LNAAEGNELSVKLLEDREPIVRRAAAAAAGKLAVRPAVDPLLKLARDADPGVRVASLESLRRLKEPRAVPLAVAALDDRVTQPAALELLGERGGPDQAAAVAALARRAPPGDVLAAAVRVLHTWSTNKGASDEQRRELERAVAEVHGASGTPVLWCVTGPHRPQTAAPIAQRYSARPSPDAVFVPHTGWRAVLAAAPDWRVNPSLPKVPVADPVSLSFTDLVVPEAAAVEFSLTGAGTVEVWLNGQSLYRRGEATTNRNTVARFTGELVKGRNRVLLQFGPPGAAVDFALTFRRTSATAAHERLTRAALAQAGNVERGRKVFLDAEKSLCLKCHRVGDQGERVGPELTGIGARFGRVYLVESILEPSQAVVPGFATLRVELNDGRVFTGVKAAETDATLTLVDAEIKKHELKKADVVEQRPVTVSAMPEGLENRLTEQEFVDLIAYLVSLKDRGPSK
jgi:putative heme-binding domain-containing protein